MLDRLTVGPLGENCYVLHAGEGRCVIVDPGEEAARILAFLDDRGLVPGLVVATHGHLDHIAALPDLDLAWEKRGLAVPLAAHRAELPYFGEAGEKTNHSLFASIRALGYFRNYWRPIREPSILLEDGDLLPGTAWRVIHCPGHSPGSICLHDAGSALLVSGDCLFRDGVGRTDGFDASAEDLHHSLMTRLFVLPEETRVFPGHGDPTSIGREKGNAVE
jgi:glyoxylase-like metal-dependent hydrolase (beta-lactamase superfamily II)